MTERRTIEYAANRGQSAALTAVRSGLLHAKLRAYAARVAAVEATGPTAAATAEVRRRQVADELGRLTALERRIVVRRP